jgi:hypothetical protein
MVIVRLWFVTKGAVTCVTELACAAQEFASNRSVLLASRADRKVIGKWEGCTFVSVDHPQDQHLLH